MYDQGLSKPEDIDAALKIGYEIKYGPFEYMDTIGLDTVKDILDGKINDKIKGPIIFELK